MKEIKSTKDYKQFKKLLGNRKVADSRVRKIINSIEKVGYITNPIIVNEKYEVVDGQGRLEALEKLGLPVEYIVQKGIGIKECISMNIQQANWGVIDYVESYSIRGNENYTKLHDLIRRYNDFSLGGLATALYGIGKFSMNVLIEGKLIIDDDTLEKAKIRLDYVRQFNETIAKMQVNRSVLRQALIYMTMFDEVDKDILLETFKKNGTLLEAYHTLRECMQSLEKLYNYKRKNYVYVYTIYDKLARINERKGIERLMLENELKKKSEENEITTAEQLKTALTEFINE